MNDLVPSTPSDDSSSQPPPLARIVGATSTRSLFREMRHAEPDMISADPRRNPVSGLTGFSLDKATSSLNRHE